MEETNQPGDIPSPHSGVPVEEGITRLSFKEYVAIRDKQFDYAAYLKADINNRYAAPFKNFVRAYELYLSGINDRGEPLIMITQDYNGVSQELKSDPHFYGWWNNGLCLYPQTPPRPLLYRCVTDVSNAMIAIYNANGFSLAYENQVPHNLYLSDYHVWYGQPDICAVPERILANSVAVLQVTTLNLSGAAAGYRYLLDIKERQYLYIAVQYRQFGINTCYVTFASEFISWDDIYAQLQLQGQYSESNFTNLSVQCKINYSGNTTAACSLFIKTTEWDFFFPDRFLKPFNLGSYFTGFGPSGHPGDLPATPVSNFNEDDESRLPGVNKWGYKFNTIEQRMQLMYENWEPDQFYGFWNGTELSPLNETPPPFRQFTHRCLSDFRDQKALLNQGGFSVAFENQTRYRLYLDKTITWYGSTIYCEPSWGSVSPNSTFFYELSFNNLIAPMAAGGYKYNIPAASLYLYIAILTTMDGSYCYVELTDEIISWDALWLKLKSPASNSVGGDLTALAMIDDTYSSKCAITLYETTYKDQFRFPYFYFDQWQLREYDASWVP